MRPTNFLLRLSAVSTVCAASLRFPILNNGISLQNPLRVQDGVQDLGRKKHTEKALDDMLDAIAAMQDKYYDLLAGTWLDAIDWTAAVMGTHISATLSSLVTGVARTEDRGSIAKCLDWLSWDNKVNRYYAQTSAFYFAENAIGLRTQAFDDMLWVVLGWLENVKFAKMYNDKGQESNERDTPNWYGLQFAPLAGHRARIFYELAEVGYDEKLCGGGMVWNPYLEPYKNAITNELFAAASIAMYLYFPGDNNTSPFITKGDIYKPHNPAYLGNAVKTYKWLADSNMRDDAGLYQDGFHITGWRKYRNGTIDPGTTQCDSLDKMVYTYNQGVILSASRGLWLATGQDGYLNDGHELVEDVIKATGWPDDDKTWRGLGRGGVLEEFCDHGSYCSQDGQTFKGIFFHHLSEFCRPLWPEEMSLISNLASSTGFDESVYMKHMARCGSYGDWIAHNAEAALMTKNDDGLFGMWWGVPVHPEDGFVATQGSQYLPEGVIDHINPLPESMVGFEAEDVNDRGRGRTVETQSGGLAVLRARWQWQSVFS